MQILHSTNSQHLALEIATSLSIPIAEIVIHKFPSGEYICKIDAALEPKITIIGSIKTNDDLMEILSIIDAAKRAGASAITLVAPYIAYGRQDAMQPPFSSVGIEIIAKILNSTDITNLITVDMHHIESLALFKINLHHITAQEIITHYTHDILHDIDMIVAPDAGSKIRLKTLKLDTIFLSKKRIDGKVLMELAGDVKGKNCLIIDDIFDSGNTMMAAHNILKNNGAKKVAGYASHFLGNTTPLLLYSTNSIVTKSEDLKILSLSPLISKILLETQ